MKWGIAGTGNIAHSFVKDLLLTDNHTIVAVGSRSIDKAEAFAQLYNCNTFYGSYQDLFNDSQPDIIYIASPHNSHESMAIQAMQSGHNVLCEKPLGVNEIQVRNMIKCAQEEKVFLMEALWSRFNPTIKEVVKRIRNGDIGEVTNIAVDFSFKSNHQPDSRIFNPHLAGGALLDIGVYPLFLSYLILGAPSSIKANAVKYSTGVDLQTAAILSYEKAVSAIYCNLSAKSDMVAKIHGDNGRIHIHGRWHEAQAYSIHSTDKDNTIELGKIGKGYTYEMDECETAIKNNQLQSDLWSWNDSINLIKMCDIIRGQIGVKYPFE